jgi:tetratricopeptide (TPR) repeat protein
LFDALAPGARPGFALWYLFGLTVVTGIALRPRRQQIRYWPLAAGTAILIWFAVLLSLYWPMQRASMATASALLLQPHLNDSAVILSERLVEENCRFHWQVGRLAHERDDIAARNEAWQQLLACSAHYTPLMQRIAPADQTLSAAAVAQQPDEAAGYFWRASQETEADPAAAIAYYEQGLALSPADGLKWVQLGHLREAAGDSDGALEAYDQGCFYVDQGKNGCMRAGRLYMAAGEYEMAAERYRTSMKQLPGWLPAQRGLTDALLAMGRGEEAIPYLTNLADNGDSSAAEQLQELLQGNQ